LFIATSFHSLAPEGLPSDRHREDSVLAFFCILSPGIPVSDRQLLEPCYNLLIAVLSVLLFLGGVLRFHEDTAPLDAAEVFRANSGPIFSSIAKKPFFFFPPPRFFFP